MTKELWKGNEALAEAAIRAGVEAYFGYPITPQTELLEYMALHMPEQGRAFLQAESEVAAINMVYGAASAGFNAMSSSSSPGISLMQEGMSYIAGSEVPCVLVDIMRGGPGLGNIQPSQADYFQMTRSAGHGDFHPIVLAPSTVQEAVDLTYESFDLANKYRHIVVILGDGSLGQMMEPVEMPPFKAPPSTRPDWALTGAVDREPRHISSLFMGAEGLEELNLRLQAKLDVIRQERGALRDLHGGGRRLPDRGLWHRGADCPVRHPPGQGKGGQGGAVPAHQPVALSRRGPGCPDRSGAGGVGGGDERRADAGRCDPHRAPTGARALPGPHGRHDPPAGGHFARTGPSGSPVQTGRGRGCADPGRPAWSRRWPDLLVPTLRVGTQTGALRRGTPERPPAFPRGAWERDLA